MRETDRSVSVSEGDRLRDRRRYVRVRERVRQIYLYFYIQRRKILSLPFLWDALLQKNLTVAGLLYLPWQFLQPPWS